MGKFKFFIRNDINFIRKDIQSSDKMIILKNLISIFEKYYSNFDIEVIDIEEQFRRANIDLLNKDVINLDCWYNSDINFRFSRVFEYGGLQDTPIGYVHDKIPTLDLNKEYTIVDDDICSGYTVNKVAEILGLQKYNTYPMLKYDGAYDVVDVRDYIIGSEYGGLLTNKGRFIYVYPHVNLKTRASLHNNILDFSKDILDLNNQILEINNIPNVEYIR